MNGILILNKPKGKTSHDMVYFVRRLFGERKVGHTGTLDPDATGVLPICIGAATRASEFIMNHNKCYRAEMVFGKATDTQDVSGSVISESDVRVSRELLLGTIEGFIGQTEQIPPMYSAVKVGGQRLYKLARAGVEIERKPRIVNIYSIELLSFDEKMQTAQIDISCSKGTYIRTLIDDIGRKCGAYAYMSSLIRTKSGLYTIDDAYSPEELENMENPSKVLKKTDTVFYDYESVILDDRQTELVKNGVNIYFQGGAEGDKFRVYGSDEKFLCISEVKDGKLSLIRSFWGRE